MDIALWVVAALLAVVFLGAGVTKLMLPKDALYEKKMTYVEDFSDGQMKGIGALELLGALGLILPAFVDGLEWLVPLAATGLFLVMVGAVLTHIRRKEAFVPPLVLGLLAAFVAIGRFWIEPL
ncbi:DoxX family protein [Knoellia sp. CPCC 206435]|uniref:DoxX family protein n=1 Tax=Knoellia terrae TaxID=3404797 RepID=UPI003B434962